MITLAFEIISKMFKVVFLYPLEAPGGNISLGLVEMFACDNGVSLCLGREFSVC